MEYLVDKYVKKPDEVNELFNYNTSVTLKVDGTAFQVYYNDETNKIEYHKRAGSAIKVGPIIDDVNRLLNKTYNKAIKIFNKKSDLISDYKFLAIEIFNDLYVLLNVIKKDDSIINDPNELKQIANKIGIDSVPVLYNGKLNNKKTDIINLFTLDETISGKEFCNYLENIFGKGDYSKFIKSPDDIEGIVITFYTDNGPKQYKIINPAFKINHKNDSENQSKYWEKYQNLTQSLYSLFVDNINPQKMDNVFVKSLQNNFLQLLSNESLKQQVLNITKQMPENKFDFKDLQFDLISDELNKFIKSNGISMKTAFEEFVYLFGKQKKRNYVISKEFQQRVNSIIDRMQGLNEHKMKSLKDYIFETLFTIQ